MSRRRHRKRNERQARQLVTWGRQVDAAMQAAGAESARLESLAEEQRANMPALKAAFFAAACVAQDPTRPADERAAARERFAAIQATARADRCELLHAGERYNAAEDHASAQLRSR